jgi:hypothetical protein
MNWYRRAQAPNLYNQLLSLRPQMAQAAQEVYDGWQGEEDATFGYGGICDEIANAMAGVIVGTLSDVNTTDGGQEGDDHAWVVAYNSVEAYGVDIPPKLYERGSGYQWTKVPDITFLPQHVEIFKLDIPVENLGENY